MPVDTNLMYAEMAGSWLVHLAIPIGVSVLISVMGYMPLSQKIMLLIAITAAISGLVQLGFLAAMQASACSGVKDYQSIATAAGLSAVLTAGMVAVPAYVPSMRLTVSQLFGPHLSLLTPAMAKINNVIAEASKEVTEASLSALPKQVGGAALNFVEYEAQEFKEVMIGAAYWAAFAGAYGIGVGSMIATKCPATA